MNAHSLFLCLAGIAAAHLPAVAAHEVTLSVEREDLLVAIERIAAQREPGAATLPLGLIRVELRELFVDHRNGGGTPLAAATAWSDWIRALVKTASDPHVEPLIADEALALLQIAIDFGFDSQDALLEGATASGVLRASLADTLAGVAAVSPGTTTATAERSRWLAPLRAIANRDLEPTQPIVVALSQEALANAVARRRSDLVEVLLDGGLAPLHAELRVTFAAALGEDEASLVLFDRHKTSLAFETEPLSVTRGRLALFAERGAWVAATGALRTLIEFEALAPAGRAQLTERLPMALRSTIEKAESHTTSELAAFLATYAGLPGGADEVAAARDFALRTALRALSETEGSVTPAAFEGRIERAIALGSAPVDALAAFDATLTADNTRSVHLAVLEALAASRPLDATLQKALDAARVRAVAERRFELLDHERIIALVAEGDAALIDDVWHYAARALIVEGLGSDAGARAMVLVTELRRLGHAPSAAVVQSLHTRAARAAASDLSVLQRELTSTSATGVVEPNALAATVLEELALSSRPGPEVWKRAEVLQRTLGLDASFFAPLCARLAERALAKGEDPFFEELARNPALAAPVATALDSWFGARVYTGHELHRGLVIAARGRVHFPGALPPRLWTDGRLVGAVRVGLASGPGRPDLALLALEQAEALGFSHAERVDISRRLVADAQLEFKGLAAALTEHLRLDGGEARHPVCLRAAFLVAVQERDWDKALTRLELARTMGALRESDAPIVAAVEAELANRTAENEQYRELVLAGSWSVVLTLDGVRSDAVTSAVVIPTRDGAANVLRCKLSGKDGDVGMAYSALYRADARTLALQFDRKMKLEAKLTPVLELVGTIRLVEPKGTVFEWTLAPREGVPAIHMRWTR